MYITDINAPVYQKLCTLIEASPEKVWNILTNIEKWPLWQKNIGSARLNGPLKEDTKFNWRVNGIPIRSTLHIVEPYSNFGWSGRISGVFAIHNWSIKELDGASVITVSESMEGFFAKFFRKFLNNYLEKDMKMWLDFLTKACENTSVLENENSYNRAMAFK